VATQRQPGTATKWEHSAAAHPYLSSTGRSGFSGATNNTNRGGAPVSGRMKCYVLIET
jgi:hypothetical protein